MNDTTGRDADLAELREVARRSEHDLRAPVRQMRSFLELLRRRDDELPEWAQGALRHMDGSLSDLTRTTGALVEYLRVVAAEPRPRSVALDQVVREAWDEATARHPGNRAPLEADGLPGVWADPDLLRTLLAAVLENAILFRRPEDDSKIRVTTTTTDDAWAIHVEDRGLGFEPEFARRAFDPFERLHPRHEPPGVGLGLTIARRVAQLHGGRMGLASVPGGGTIVDLHLPRREAV